MGAYFFRGAGCERNDGVWRITSDLSMVATDARNPECMNAGRSGRLLMDNNGNVVDLLS